MGANAGMARPVDYRRNAALSDLEAPASAAASRNSATPITAAIANAVQNRFTFPSLSLAVSCNRGAAPPRPGPVAGKDANEATSVPIPWRASRCYGRPERP